MDQPPGSPQGPRDQGSQDAHALPTCYRHPDRETGIRCTRCERPICPECMVSASVGFQCPDCIRGGSGTGQPRPPPSPGRSRAARSRRDPRLVTKVLIGLNVALYMPSRSAPSLLTDRFTLFGRGPPRRATDPWAWPRASGTGC